MNPLPKNKTENRLAQEELARRALFARYRKDPLFWLEDRFGENPAWFKWSLFGEKYRDHVWDGTKDPLATAWYALANKQWAGIESATGVGKTFFLARVVYWFLDVYEDSLVVTSSAVAQQLKTQLWAEMGKVFHKFKRLRPSAKWYDTLCLKVDGSHVNDDKGGDELGKDDSLNGWAAYGIASKASSGSSSNNRRQGFHRKHMLIICEEATGLSHADLTAYENTCTGGNNLILCVGNPDNQLDTLHTFCKKDGVMHIRASAYDHPNIVLGKELLPGAITQISIDRRKQNPGELSPIYLSRVRGISPEQSENSLVKLEWINACIEAARKGQVSNGGASAAGVDAANSQQGDKGAVAIGRGNRLVFLKDFQCPNASHLAYNLLYDDDELLMRGYINYGLPTLEEYNIAPHRVGVDGVGIGVSTIHAFNERLVDKQVVSLQGGAVLDVIPKDYNGKPAYNFASLRAQMYWKLREDLREGKILIDLDDEALLLQLKQELTAPTWRTSNNRIELESKDSIKGRLGYSPNCADAVVYWNWVRGGIYTIEDGTSNIEFDIA